MEIIVNGTRSVMTLPAWEVESMSMVPRKSAILRFTTSIPMPRPETCVVPRRVVNPGISVRRASSRSLT